VSTWAPTIAATKLRLPGAKADRSILLTPLPPAKLLLITHFPQSRNAW
jgi:hypothetical protein